MFKRGGKKLIILVIVAVFLLSKIRVNAPSASPTPTPINKIDNFPASEYPKEFPREIPIEAGAVIVSNYNATAPDGRLQASRVFASAKTVQANFDLYKSWLPKNGWTLSDEDDGLNPDRKSLLAQKGVGVLNISIVKSITGAVSVVDISYVTLK